MFENSFAMLFGLGMPGPPELMIIAAIFLLLFGGAKLPGLMRNLGRSVNEFKTGLTETPVERIQNDSPAEAEIG